MAEYIRDYPQAPTAEEIQIGYAPSTIKGSPFAKFLFWTFAGLAVAFVITWGAVAGIDALVQAHDQAQYKRAARVVPVPVQGPRLQPSPEHPYLDFEDMERMTARANEQQLATGGWERDPARAGQLKMSEPGVRRAVAAINAPKPTTKPAGTN